MSIDRIARNLFCSCFNSNKKISKAKIVFSVIIFTIDILIKKKSPTYFFYVGRGGVDDFEFFRLYPQTKAFEKH